MAITVTNFGNAVKGSSGGSGSVAANQNDLLVVCLSNTLHADTVWNVTSPDMVFTPHKRRSHSEREGLVTGGNAAIYIGVVPSTGNRSVSFSGEAFFTCYKVTGYDSAQPTGNTAEGSDDVTPALATWQVSALASVAFIAVASHSDDEGSTSVLGITGTSRILGTDENLGSAFSAPSNGMTETFTLTLTDEPPEFQFAVVEIRPGGQTTGSAAVGGGGAIGALGKATVKGAAATSGGGATAASAKRTVYGVTAASSTFGMHAASAHPGELVVDGGGLLAASGKRTVYGSAQVASPVSLSGFDEALYARVDVRPRERDWYNRSFPERWPPLS